MCGGKCDCRRGFCPFTFGLAWGITYALTIFIMSVAVMQHMSPPGMPFVKGEELTWALVWMHSFVALVSGFIYGLVFALLYDGILKLSHKCKCGAHEGQGTCRCGGNCSCGCKCGATDKKIDDITR